jgi:predicted ATPase
MLFDREAELASLRDALDSARAGRGRIVVVEGEPGIGKTALLEHARAAADESGFVVLRAAGAELERDFAWGVARQLFEPIVHRGVAALAAGRRGLLSGQPSA